jgi:NTE family protein
MKIFPRKYRTGLVLSGGAVRGIAHLGILQSIIEHHIQIDIISGTSAGAIAGAFFSDGFSPYEILELFSKKKFYELIRVSFLRSGFFKVQGLKKILKQNLKTRRLEELPIPLIVSATNFIDGKIEYFDSGDLINILIASSSIPILFKITKINGIFYTDGGIMDNLPVDPIRKKCRKIIAVHVNPIGHLDKLKSPVQAIERIFHLAVASEIQRKKNLVDLFIEPSQLIKYGLFDLRDAKTIFQVGYDSAQEILNASLFK